MSIFILLSSFFLFGCNKKVEESYEPIQKTDLRIISMAPSCTEIIYALGLLDQLVAVTAYCDFPQEALQLPKVGYYEANYEMILSMKPDIVVLTDYREDVQTRLESIGIQTLVLNTSKKESIMDSILTAGKVLNKETRAKEIVQKIHSTIKLIQDEIKDRPTVKVLITVGRNMGTGDLKNVYAAGKGTYFDELLEIAGGENVYTGSIPYANISKEGFMRMNPDIIIDLVSLQEFAKTSEEEILREWAILDKINAVKNNQVHVINADYVVIPGPRFPLLLEDFAEIVKKYHESDRSTENL